MAKGIGLIGNFRGKVGNMVGYNLKDSNNKQTQGVRVYQPIVKNPKTYAQAEQRAKLAPINATYRALKLIIDRGQEGKAYGNKSRLAWLSAAMKAFNGGWFEKGAAITAPAIVPLTKGSLSSLIGTVIAEDAMSIKAVRVSAGSPTTMGDVSANIIAGNPNVSNGDQITFIMVSQNSNSIVVTTYSIVIDTESTDAIPAYLSDNEVIVSISVPSEGVIAGAIILSREGDNGQHLRSSENLVATDAYPSATQGNTAKEAAIKSYMAAGSNIDWAEESLQG